MKEKTRYNFLIFACAFLWIMMMGSKNVYTAELVEIGVVFGVNKAEASLAMTYYFVTYSIAQIILFFFMDNLDLKWYILVSIFASGIITVVVAFASGMTAIWWLLALNGILQAGVWGMCLAVLKRFLPSTIMPKANAVMNVGMSIAAVLSYSSSAIAVAIDRWNLPFIILGAILSLSAIIFFIAVKLCEKIGAQNHNNILESTSDYKTPFTLKTKNSKAIFFIVTFAFSLLIHFPYYAVLNWLPSLLTDNFMIDNSTAILVSTFAPLATVLGAVFSIRHCEKKDFINVSVLYLIITVVLVLLLSLLFKVNAILSIIIVVCLLIVVQGSITIVFSVLSIKMGKFINTGAHASLMNAAGGFAAGFAPTIMGAIIDGSGWFTAYLSLFIVCVVTALALVFIKLCLNKKKI